MVDHNRLLHLHGEKGARLNNYQSIHPERKRSFMIKILSPILLFGPEVHLRKLVEKLVDSLIPKHVWHELLVELTNDWKEFTLYVSEIEIEFILLGLELALGNRFVKCKCGLFGHSKRRQFLFTGPPLSPTESKLLFSCDEYRSDFFRLVSGQTA
jgi:hypothetical protein